MKFVIRNASASRQLSGYFASMRFDQQQCFVLSLITRMLADSIQHRPIFCNRFVEGICLELHAVSLFVITEFRFPTLIRHFAKIQSAELVEYFIFMEALSLFLDIPEWSDRFRYHNPARFLPDFPNERFGIAFTRILTASGQFDFSLIILNQKQFVSVKNNTAHSYPYIFVHILIVVFRIQ